MTETGWTGRDAERVAHDSAGNRTYKWDHRANSAQASGKMAREGRKRRAGSEVLSEKTVRARWKHRADRARPNGKTLRTGRKRRAGSQRRDGKRRYYGRETVNHERGGGKNNASRPLQQTQRNTLAVTPEKLKPIPRRKERSYCQVH